MVRHLLTGPKTAAELLRIAGLRFGGEISTKDWDEIPPGVLALIMGRINDDEAASQAIEAIRLLDRWGLISDLHTPDNRPDDPMEYGARANMPRWARFVLRCEGIDAVHALYDYINERDPNGQLYFERGDMIFTNDETGAIYLKMAGVMAMKNPYFKGVE